MPFIATLDQPHFAEGAALQITHVGGEKPPRDGSRVGFDMAVALRGETTNSIRAMVSEDYGPSILLALENGSAWRLHRVPTHPSFGSQPPSASTYWVVDWKSA